MNNNSVPCTQMALGVKPAGKGESGMGKKTILITVAACVAFLVIFTLIMIFAVAPRLQYSLACQAYEDKRYEEAINRFNDIEDYEDSAEKKHEIQLLQVQKLMDAGQYYEAAAIYQKLNDRARYYDALYQYSSQLVDNQDYEKAIEILEKLGEYRDCQEKIPEIRYLYGMKLVEEGNFQSAIRIFTDLDDYKDSRNRIKECYYKTGLQLMKNWDYENAIKEFGKCGNYSDSKTRVKECHYKTGLQLLGKKDYTEAIDEFARSGDYTGGKKRIKECYYKIGEQLLKDEQYTDAVEAFAKAGDYSDSKAKLKSAQYAYVKNNQNREDEITYQYLKDLKTANYKDSKKIYDSLFAWKVTDIYFNTSSYSSDRYSSISKYSAVSCHFTVTGGPPEGRTYIYCQATWPDGSSNKKQKSNSEFSDSSEGSWTWSDGIYSDPYWGETGKFTVRFYDGSGNVIGKASVTITG